MGLGQGVAVRGVVGKQQNDTTERQRKTFFPS